MNWRFEGRSKMALDDATAGYPLSSVVEVKRESHAYEVKIPPGISFFSNI